MSPFGAGHSSITNSILSAGGIVVLILLVTSHDIGQRIVFGFRVLVLGSASG